MRTALVVLLLNAAGCSAAKTPATPAGTCHIDPKAAPISFAGIFNMTGSSSSLQQYDAEQFTMAVAEANAGCGTIGSASMGAAVDGYYKDGQDTLSVTTGLTHSMLDSGVQLMVGGTSAQALAGSIVAAIAADVPYAMNGATADNLSGCTAAQLAEGVLAESTLPSPGDANHCFANKGLSIRDSTVSSVWGAQAAAYTRTTFPNATQFATFFREGDSAASTITAAYIAGMTGSGATLNQNIAYNTGSVATDYQNYVQLLLQGGPQVVMMQQRIGELDLFLEALATMQNPNIWTLTSKPANYNQIQYISVSSVQGDYTTLSPGATQIMATQFVGVAPYWDATSIGFQKWLAYYQSYNPEGQVQFHTQLRAYDATILMLLALTKANTTEPNAFSAALLAVSNPPGVIVYPGEFAKARALIMAGTAIDYEGASGLCNLLSSGNVEAVVYDTWSVDAAGHCTILSTISPP